ncbi:NADH dehydrogenase [ubiquinone] 1 alpha subcomplex subunit 9, mitochondrial-like [Cimex lectularius]|uniref:NADH dehydrogenase [ubiquinone] 1 alpha subcomplex subunit 9, mitochondrial n=1 Tax=Cimex lectularius TaxID=79782 RepID=A0A8I6SAT0_CIMLE|nr:NADH dehydrogenase [ubiquinone] 1 alpha subcomplex subunit 9, mitochondrial-like [Cimex lectularius]
MAAAAIRYSQASKLCVPICGSIQQCYMSSDGSKRVSLAKMKRGTGGRSSFNGLVCTVFGSSGFMGRYVCNKLGKIGSQLILPYRGDAYDMRMLKLVGDLGQVLFQPYYLRDEESIYKCVQYSNVVINLVGRDWETKNFSFHDVHVKGARSIAKMAKKAGVETFVHVSALNATEYPEPYMLKGGSKFLASKWEGENAVREEFPEAIIFRPSDIYGQEDRFLRYYCSNMRHQLKFMPLYKKGEYTEKQPVFVEDVAAGIVNACKDRMARGNVYQAVGPNRYLLSELVDWFHRVTRKAGSWDYFRYDMRFDPLFQMRVSLMPYFSLGFPLGNIHWERVERECHSDQVDKNVKTLEDLGVSLTYMENQVPWELRVYRAQAYYEEELGEFDTPSPPPTVAV